jgi:hypothetical protein
MSNPTDVTKYLGKEAPTVSVSFNKRDLILYAVGIGCSELNFVYVYSTFTCVTSNSLSYENSPNFSAFPTYPIVLGFKGTDQDVVGFPSGTMAKTMIMPSLPGMIYK